MVIDFRKLNLSSDKASVNCTKKSRMVIDLGIKVNLGFTIIKFFL